MFNLFKKNRTKIQGTTVRLKIEGMHCTSCANNIDLTLEDTPGIFEADTHFQKSELVVSFDENLIKLGVIKKKLEEMGYNVVGE